MDTLEIENKIKSLCNKISQDSFIYDLLEVYGTSKAQLTRAKKDNDKLSKNENQLIIKRKLLFENVSDGRNLLSVITELDKDIKTHSHKPRFIIVTNFKHLLAIDTKTKDTLDIKFNDLYTKATFFLPWTGKEKYQIPLESAADIKAAEKMAKIYDEIYYNNKSFANEYNHDLNQFLTRLLFCLFAEDTGIFPSENIFTKALADHTDEDGHNLKLFFQRLFDVLDESDIKKKQSFPSYLKNFPYVNGQLFTKQIHIPELTSKVRKLIIECGELNWKEINPDIFGSMFQAVKVAEVRSGLGQHYTSVPNIMKVINPLFMDNLREEFDKSFDDVKKLQSLQIRLSKIRIFDPACGSGNFLIIAFKQIKLLEMDIIKRINNLQKQNIFQMNLSQIYLNQFYGIEIDDFACEIAKLSLWLAEHQMNCKFKEDFGIANPTLPLGKSGYIVCGNACRLNWEKVCPKYVEDSNLEKECNRNTLQNTPLKLDLPKEEAEVYILGNPPYEGARKQSQEQKEDLSIVFNKSEEYKNADYIIAWFIKAANYAKNTNIPFSFVSTQSITQGEQIGILWPKIFDQNLEIFFAYKAFRWSNNAKRNAGIICVIIGIKKYSVQTKFLYTDGLCEHVKNISPYLTTKNSYMVLSRKQPLSKLPKMILGNMARDGGNLILSTHEKNKLLEKYPNANIFIKRLYGSKEFIRGEERWCLWIDDKDLKIALSYPEIEQRVQKVYNFRLASKAKTTNQYAKVSHRFAQISNFKEHAIIIPSTSSEHRNYIPMGFLDKTSIITNAALTIYDPAIWILGILMSKIHMIWVKYVCGTLGTSPRYSVEICYNPFPFPDITDQQKKRIEICVNDVLAVREKYSEKTMAELYNMDSMPKDLIDAHHSLDIVIEQCYKKAPFKSDDERLEHLFKRYEMMINNVSDDELKQLELL